MQWARVSGCGGGRARVLMAESTRSETEATHVELSTMSLPSLALTASWVLVISTKGCGRSERYAARRLSSTLVGRMIITPMREVRLRPGRGAVPVPAQTERSTLLAIGMTRVEVLPALEARAGSATATPLNGRTGRSPALALGPRSHPQRPSHRTRSSCAHGFLRRSHLKGK